MTHPVQKIAASQWAAVARDHTTGHFWHLRRRSVRPQWNMVQCGCCGLAMTSHTLASLCRGLQPENEYLFEDFASMDEDLDFVDD